MLCSLQFFTLAYRDTVTTTLHMYLQRHKDIALMLQLTVTLRPESEGDAATGEQVGRLRLPLPFDPFLSPIASRRPHLFASNEKWLGCHAMAECHHLTPGIVSALLSSSLRGHLARGKTRALFPRLVFVIVAAQPGCSIF